MRNDHPFDLAATAASAGGIQALGQVLSQLPADYPVPIAVVQHRTGHLPDRLASVLQHRTRLEVARAVSGEPIKAGRVYLAPSTSHMILQADHSFGFTDGRRIHHILSLADPLMISAAEILGPRLLAVVLTGGNADASEGVRAVKAAGGIVIAGTWWAARMQ